MFRENEDLNIRAISVKSRVRRKTRRAFEGLFMSQTQEEVLYSLRFGCNWESWLYMLLGVIFV